MTDGPARFFAFARARHAIALARRVGRPRPWTDDPILAHYRFTNVFREMDATTVWIRQHVRDRLSRMCEEDEIEPWQVVLGVTLARTLNRMQTLEQIFCQERLIPRLEACAWAYIRNGEGGAGVTSDELQSYMRQHCRQPWVTGAYIVKTPDGMDKLAGALWIVERARELLLEGHRTGALDEVVETMQDLHSALVTFPYLGGFSAYEIVTDLRHTVVGRDWPDIMTWANAGPGAVRGLHRIHGREHTKSLSQTQALAEMRDLLRMSSSNEVWPRVITPEYLQVSEAYDTLNWPQYMWGDKWPVWEMREVEHTLCEFDKYERARLGQGRPRGVYR